MRQGSILAHLSRIRLPSDSARAITSSMPPRIVVDTNVFIAALLSPSGSNREVLRACFLGKAVPLIGAALFHEYEDVLGRAELMRKCPLKPKERQLFFSSFLSLAEWIKVYYLWRPNLPDEGDNHLIELAIAGAAEAIVTNNLGDLGRGELSFPSLHILTPRQFLSHLP
jgi:putative PIN family toxin of toxin-antitoxin system